MSFIESQDPVLPKDEGVKKVFRVRASDIEGPLDILKTDGLPRLYDYWKPLTPMTMDGLWFYLTTFDPILPVCVSVNVERKSETLWTAVATYAQP